MSIEYFNPIGNSFTPKEKIEYNSCNLFLYVITPELTEIYSIAEAVDSSNKKPNNTLFCVLKDRNESFDDKMLNSLKDITSLIKKNNSVILESINDIADYLNNYKTSKPSKTSVPQLSDYSIKQTTIKNIKFIEGTTYDDVLMNDPWLLKNDSNIEDAEVYYYENYLTWRSGTWHNGIWYNGTWQNGLWKNGTWQNGTWLLGIWDNGTWHNGTWNNGVWNDGTWNEGLFIYGIWFNGTWNNGIWDRGIWGNGFDKNYVSHKDPPSLWKIEQPTHQ